MPVRKNASVGLPSESNGRKRRAGGQGTPRYPRNDRWNELLTVSAGVFYQNGYQAATMQEIADELNILKGSLYHYIDTKSDILYGIVERVHKTGRENLLSSIDNADSSIDKLMSAIVSHIDFIGNNLVDSTVSLRDSKYLSIEQRAKLLDGPKSYESIFKDLVVACKLEGKLKASLDVGLTAALILSSLNSVARSLEGKSKTFVKDVGTHFSIILLDGIRAQR